MDDLFKINYDQYVLAGGLPLLLSTGWKLDLSLGTGDLTEMMWVIHSNTRFYACFDRSPKPDIQEGHDVANML